MTTKSIGLVLWLAIVLWSSPSPASGGEWIAFGSFRDGDFSGSLLAVQADGSEETMLWSHEGGRPAVLDPWVSADGRFAFFSRGSRDHRTSAWMVDLTKSEESQRTDRVMVRFDQGRVWPSMRPSSRDFVFVQGSSPKNRRVKLQSEQGSVADLASGELPSWSPSGDLLAVVRRVDSKPAIWLLKVEDSVVVSEHKVFENATYPSWAPDGKSLLVSRILGDQFDLFAVDLQGKVLEQLTHSPDRSERAGQWSPDRQLIAFAALASDPTDGWQHSIFVLNIESGEVQELTSGRFHDSRPSWIRHRERQQTVTE